MNSDWKNYNLIEHIDVKHGFAFKGKHITTKETDNILLTPGNFNIGGGFKSDKFKYYDTDQFPSEYILKKDDLIVTMTDLSKTGDTLGYAAKVPKTSRKKYLHNQRLGLINFITKDLDKDFLYWRLRTKKYQQFIVNSATGSTVRHTSPKRILEYSFNAPKDIQAQNKISHILSTLDDKIELNRKMNQTLEEMTQALFKSWFVDFDPVHAKADASSDADFDRIAKELGISREILDLFPDEFEESELGMIPKEWRVVGFKDLVKKYIDNRGKTPPIEDEGIPLLEVRSFPSDILLKGHKTDKFVSEKTYATWFRSHLESDDILISTVGTIGLTCIVPKGSRFTIAQNVLGIRANEEILLKKYMYYMMKNKSFINEINARLITTVQSSIKRKDMETIITVIPPLDIQDKFVQIIQPMMSYMQSNQNNDLQKTRDTLLPKLLSGELDVSELELDHVTH